MRQEINDTNLLHYLGKSPELKILDFLIENKRASWNITEIEAQGGIARSTIKMAVPKLLGLGLIKVERSIGRSRLYTINDSSPIISSVIKLSAQIDSIESDKRSKVQRKAGVAKRIAALN